MPGTHTGYVAECFWVGVGDDDLRLLDERATRSIASLAGDGENVRYLGSVLMRSDEVVLCFFEGSAAGVRRAAEMALIPFERILETAGSPWAAVQTRKAEGDGSHVA
ncbi:MAG TPA: hypothetical protein VJT78_05040 [Candidatus Dormibacteraeota bacterium]|nr:hypothetical protein [Candidatus Dormibacteraeota bacterium]